MTRRRKIIDKKQSFALGQGFEILDHINIGFQLLDKNFVYVFLNNAAIKQSRCNSRSELIGKSMMEKFPGIENSDMFRLLRDCMDHQCNARLENEFHFPDGKKGWFELNITGIPEGAIILSEDITIRKLLEVSKEKHIERLEEMMFATSHKVRQPVSQIKGISHLLEKEIVTLKDLNKVKNYLKNSLNDLDHFTKELSDSIYNLKQHVAK